jgi:hypothetical protein
MVGRLDWKASQTDEGHREYDIDFLIHTDDPNDGPYTIGSSGVGYYPGTIWNFGNDLDIWAYCQPNVTVTPLVTGEKSNYWKLSQKFSTKANNRDQQDPPGNPLLEPPEVSGSFVKYTREAVEDKDGKAIRSSSLERFKGASVERDDSRHSITIKKNIPTLPLATWRTMMDTTNSHSMWGLPANTVKLSNISWAKKYYGTNLLSFYYAVTYEFDITFESFTRKILDEGTRTLKAGGDAQDPKDFVPYNGVVLLNGAGLAITEEADVTYLSKDLYKQTNLFSLGIPTSL